MDTNQLIPAVSLDNLLQQRDAMVERIRKAHALLEETNALADAMFPEMNSGYRLSLRCKSGHDFVDGTGLQEMIREIDGRAWSYLLQKSGLQTFLDAEARETWRKAIDKNDVPELTRANVEATFSALYETRGTMFERGVVEIFRQLSWDYKTNTPVKFGKRLILRGILDTWGGRRGQYTSLAHNGADRLDDLIRVMSVLEGKPEPDHRHGAYHRLRALGWPKEAPLADLGYFTVRGFMNGNGHLTFTCPDLVDKLNLILAKHHPNALAAARE